MQTCSILLWLRKLEARPEPVTVTVKYFHGLNSLLHTATTFSKRLFPHLNLDKVALGAVSRAVLALQLSGSCLYTKQHKGIPCPLTVLFILQMKWHLKLIGIVEEML